MPKIKVGITVGDPSGIGPVITLKAIKKLKGFADFTVIGQSAKMPGKVRAESGRASIAYLDQALELLGQKKIDCLVTCPISKVAINLAGFKYSGHTEYFSEKLGVKNTVMMLLNQKLKFSLITRHIALKQVPEQLNRDKIYATVKTTSHYLKKYFGIRQPRLVICGLNPHASDSGLIGDEENRIVIPAVKRLRANGIYLVGPLSADVAIAKAYKRDFDCVIALYHDQALIPLKLTGADTGINLTLGLPFVRTSPLHGTAFDIAAHPAKADPSSLIAAIKLAVRCVA